MEEFRIESDSMGEIKVPKDCYWGAQTQRSIAYFTIGKELMPLQVIYALILLKKAAAISNTKLGVLDKKIATLIINACDLILAGSYEKNFPLHVWMTGSGTQSNMNVNEVIANLANETIGNSRGSKNPVHPNDHVNMSQSSNDIFPSAMSVATVSAIKNKLFPALNLIIASLNDKIIQWDKIVKIGRTHMQDAVPITLAQEFSGYKTMLEEGLQRIESSLSHAYHLALGGTAVGTGVNAPKEFAFEVAQTIQQLSQLPFSSAKNKFAVQGAHDALVAVSGSLKGIAGSLFKIANDIRLLSCGPRAGLYELIIPANEPGSSMMPGKTNPTQCEALTMVCLQVIANDVAVTMGGASGMLEMNVYKPLMIYNIIQSIELLSDAITNFTKFLLVDTVANQEKIAQFLHNSLMLVTALSPIIGYDRAAKLAHHAHQHNCSLQEANQTLAYLSDIEFTKMINPLAMTQAD